MRVAVLAMQEQTRLRAAGAQALKESEVDVDDARLGSTEGFAIDLDDPEGDARRAVVAFAAWRLLVARLTGAAVTRASLVALRQQCGEDALLVATGGITSALLSLPGLDDKDVSAVARARADARQLVTNPADVAASPARAAAAAAAFVAADPLAPSPSSLSPTTIPAPGVAPWPAPTGAPTSAPVAELTPESPGDASTKTGVFTVQRAIARAVGAATIVDDVAVGPTAVGPARAPPEDAGTPLALLRARAHTASAARSLRGVARTALARLPVRTLEHAADELVVGAGVGGDELLDESAIDDAVTVLVRAAAAIATSLPEGAPLGFGLVVVGAAGDVVDALVRAAVLGPHAAGQLALDDDAWERAGELAPAPGEGRAVEARTPWGVDRWQLSAALPRPPFVGREDDVRACAALLGGGDGGGGDGGGGDGSGGDGRPRLLVLTGAAGIGKASLVRRALQEARLLDERAVVLWGAADPLQPTPGASIVGMVRALARAPAGHPRAETRVRRLVHGLADSLVDDEAVELRALGGTLVDLLGAGDGEDAGADRSPRALRGAIRRATLLLARALRARAGDGRPAVFVVSGAEDIDAPTRDTLAFVAQQLGGAARVVLLATARPRLPAAFEELFAVTRHEVAPLHEDDARALAGALLDQPADTAPTGLASAADAAADDDADDDAAADAADDADDDADDDGPVVSLLQDDALPRSLAALHERARGSPLFVAHGVRWAVEGGLLQKKADPWGKSATRWDASRFAEAVAAGRMPSRLDKLLQARVLRLPQAARQVLSSCAVLGHVFTAAAVTFVGTRLGLVEDAVRDAVRLLTATGFLAQSRPRPGAPVFEDAVGDDDALLTFEHPLLRAVAEQALSDDEAAAVHGVVALALEALLDTRAIASALARHHKAADRRRAALEHLVVAARRARRLDDRQGAQALAREGLDLCLPDEHDTLFALQLELCAVLEPAAAHGERQQATLKEALRQLVRVAERTGSARHLATAQSRVARFHLFSGDAPRAEESAARALERARAAAADDGGRALRDVLRLLALVRFARHDVDGARRALNEARRHTRPDERRVLGVIDHQAGLYCLEGNEPLTALTHLLAATGHKRACSDPAGEAACIDLAADVYVRTGRLWTALRLVEGALALRARQGDAAGIAHGTKNRAEVLLQCGDLDGAAREAGRARALARGLSLDRLERQASIVLARVELARDAAAAAEAVLDNMRRRVDGVRDPFAAMEAELLSARAKWQRALRATGAARERLLKTAHARASAAVALGERRGFLSGQVLGNALLGDVLVSSGDAGLALPYALRAVELLDDRASGLPVEEVLAAVARVQRAVGDDDEADAALRRAHALLAARARHLPADERARFWSVPARRALLDAVGPSAS